MSERFTTSDGIGIAYHVRGDDLSRPPVFLHHGFAASAQRNWVAPGIVTALQAAGRRVVTIDARGHGDSDKPHDPAFYGEDRMARDLCELVDRLGEATFDLAGYSMGAIVSLIAATREPRLRRLVVGGVGEGILTQGGVDTRAVPNEAIAAALEAEDAATVTGPAVGFRRLADATGADRLALAAQARSVHKQRITLEQITAPTLLLAGDNDPLAVHPDRLAGAIPGGTYEVISGDHLTVVGHPRFAAAIVAFLD